MSKEQNNKVSLFQKVVELGHTYVDSQIFKAKTTILNSNIEDEFNYGKAVVEDPSYSLHAQGYLEKPYRIQNGHLKQMSYQDSVIAAVIQTRQNQVAQHTKLVDSEKEKGFMVRLKDEKEMLKKIKDELRAEMKADEILSGEKNEAEKAAQDGAVVDGATPIEGETKDPIQKADGEIEAGSSGDLDEETSLEGAEDKNPEENSKSDDEAELIEFELERKARKKLDEMFEKDRKKVQDYILNCGLLENRPFETMKWNFNSAARAFVRDSLTYDLYAAEKVPDKAGRPHHWFPVDGGTIKRASKDLKKFKDVAENFYNIDILYPERTKEAQQRQKAIDLKDNLLEADAYKWVQVVRGKVERAYTNDELGVGIRNLSTDIYNNGYGISELELLITMVTGHLNAEYYNQAYFTQGFSAKGILHIKAALNRRKVETVRTQWYHMLKGTRNSFQTPIFAGVEEVNWIPLTQNHNDIGFEGWMRYLVTMIGAIYQIDPAEMGIHFKAEGNSGLGGSKDDTKEKTENSKDKGLYPLLRHLQNYMTEQIIKPFDKRFEMVFTGCDGETALQVLNRQKEESKFKKTVNEIRAEDGLPPLPGMDDVILGPEFMTWYAAFSPKAIKKQGEDRKQQEKQFQMQLDQQAKMGGMEEEQEVDPATDIYGEGAVHMNSQPFEMAKSFRRKKRPLTIEVYKLEKK